jgi:hypothetical protein
MELFYLYTTINDIHVKSLQNLNKILLLIDPWYKDTTKLNYGVQVFNWKIEEETKVMAYKKISHSLINSKVNGSILHSNLVNKEQMLINLQHSELDDKNFNEIIEEIKKSVDNEIKFLPNTNDSANNINLFNIKKQLMLTERFLIIIENYLNDANTDDEILHNVDYILQELVYYFDREEVLKIVQQEFKDNQIIDAFSNLLNLQIKITEKINKFNL